VKNMTIRDLKKMSLDEMRYLLASGISGDDYNAVLEAYTERKRMLKSKYGFG